MMTLELLGRSMLIGLAIAAPVGPIGLLVIRRTLEQGQRAGLAAGMGAALADALYGAIGALGLGSLASLLASQARWLQLLGGLALVVIGARSLRTPPAALPPATAPAALLGAVLTTFGLTLTNPLTIASFAAMFAAIDPQAAATPAGALALVGGVCAGSALWWLGLTTAVARLRRTLAPAMLRPIGWLAGVALVALGMLGIAAGIR
jgi:threonine/homoserine/homoserine lactone efflux protein